MRARSTRAYLFGSLKEVALDHGGVEEIVNDIELVGPYNGGSYVLVTGSSRRTPTTTKDFVGRHREGSSTTRRRTRSTRSGS